MGADTHGEEYPAGSIGAQRLEIEKKFYAMYASMAENLYKEGVRAAKSDLGDRVFKMQNGQEILSNSTLWEDLENVQRVQDWAIKSYDEGVRATKDSGGTCVYRFPDGHTEQAVHAGLWPALFKLQGQKNASRFCSNEVEDFKPIPCAQMPNVHGLEPEQIQTSFPVIVRWSESDKPLEEDEGYKQIAEYSGAVVGLAVAAKELIEASQGIMWAHLPGRIQALIGELENSLEQYDATVLKMGKALGI